MIRDCKVILIRVPRNEEGKAVTGGEYKAMVATKENVVLDGDKVLYREWVAVTPVLTMVAHYEELFRARLAHHLCSMLHYKQVGLFKFNILDKLLGGRDYDIPFEHLQALVEKL